jgi:hypothetical protein
MVFCGDGFGSMRGQPKQVFTAGQIELLYFLP